MIKDFNIKWFKNKNKLEKWFANNKQSEYDDYEKIVKKVLEIIVNDNEDDYCNYSIVDLTTIDNGDYQGTLLFLTHLNRYQPDFNDYIVTHNYYGSCSGCDTLLGIISYSDDELPSKNQIDELMDLSLHIIQNFHSLDDLVKVDNIIFGKEKVNE